MTGTLAQVAENFGRLVGVQVSEFQLGWIEAIHLNFQRGNLTIEVEDDTDTVQWSVGPRSPETGVAPAVWLPLLESRVRWIWLRNNDRGFQDGIQIEFSTHEVLTLVQIMAEGSRLSIFRVLPATSLDSPDMSTAAPQRSPRPRRA